MNKLAAGPGAGHYYVDRVAHGREDYYAGEGEAPGTWMGGGAAMPGLAGEVSEQGSCGCSRSATPRQASCCASRFRPARMHRYRTIDAYRLSTGGNRDYIDAMDGSQPGRSAKATRAILHAIDAADAPHRGR